MQQVSNNNLRLAFFVSSFLCLTASFSTIVNATTNVPAWESKRSNDSINVLQRSVQNSKYMETKGTLRTNARLFAIIGVLHATEECELWLYNCRFAKTIEQLEAGKSLYYMVIDSPFFLKDRDMYVRSSTSFYPLEKRVAIQLTGVQDYAPPEHKRVRVLNLRGAWEVRELDNGEVLVSYQIHFDPQISAKGSVDSTMITSVFETLEKIDQLAHSKPYRDTVFSEQQIQSITVLPQ